MKLISFCGKIVCILLLSAVAINAQICDQYEIPVDKSVIVPPIIIYPPIDPILRDLSGSQSFQARKSMKVEFLYSRLLLYNGSYHFELTHNNSLIAAWDNYSGSYLGGCFMPVSFDLKYRDTIVLKVYGGAIWGGLIKLCGSPIISLSDAILILKALTGITPSQDEMNQVTDINGDGKIGLEDCIYALQVIGELRIQSGKR